MSASTAEHSRRRGLGTHQPLVVLLLFADDLRQQVVPPLRLLYLREEHSMGPVRHKYDSQSQVTEA